MSSKPQPHGPAPACHHPVRRPAPHPVMGRHNLSGIALPTVLGILVVAAALCGTIAMTAASSYRSTILEHLRLRDHWLLAAGLNRAVAAIVTPGDPMREPLFEEREADWMFADHAIALSLENESEKVDVNVADQRLVLDRLAVILQGSSGRLLDYATQRLRDARERHEIMIEPEMLLPPARRVGTLAQQVRHVLTTVTGQPAPAVPAGVAPVDGAPTGFAPLRPIYRLTALLHPSGIDEPGVVRRKDVTIIIGANDQKAFRIVDGDL